MKKHLNLFIWLLLVSMFAFPRPAQAQNARGAVQGWFFWMDGCPHCADVLQNVMPEISQRYGNRLELTYVEIVDLDDVHALYQIAAEYGLSKEETGVPMIILNHQALVGADTIARQLDAAIQDALSLGGADYDALAILPGHVSQSPPAIHPAETKSNGFLIAQIVLAGMILVVLYEFYLFAIGTERAAARPNWQVWMVFILTIAGLGIAFYLGYVESAHTNAICGPVGDCNSVQHSPYARLFGVIPIAWLGFASYAFILFTSSFARWKAGTRWARWAELAQYITTFLGTLFSIYLTYLEPFVIHAVCMWCVSSAIIMTLLLLLSTQPALQALNEELF